jgi:hypothetical protein
LPPLAAEGGEASTAKLVPQTRLTFISASAFSWLPTLIFYSRFYIHMSFPIDMRDFITKMEGAKAAAAAEEEAEIAAGHDGGGGGGAMLVPNRERQQGKHNMIHFISNHPRHQRLQGYSEAGARGDQTLREHDIIIPNRNIQLFSNYLIHKLRKSPKTVSERDERMKE